MLVTAFANEMSAMVGKKVSLFVHKGSESLSMWFGGTEETLRRLFASAQRAKPSVIFFDEIDAICPRRTSRLDESSPAYSQIVTAILGMIDSVKRGEVFIIAATNLVRYSFI
jgi:SpoVK/Ycf46/Vps4 family AAA+-type ATPase